MIRILAAVVVGVMLGAAASGQSGPDVRVAMRSSTRVEAIRRASQTAEASYGVAGLLRAAVDLPAAIDTPTT